jgi:medium-chain acyl-[acyl-carrier-protein] hydrolase
MTVAQARWFETVQGAKEGAPRLFCFPYAGGSTQVFRSWQRQFAPEITLCLAHLPGRAMRIGEPPFRGLKPLVAALAQAIINEPQGPFAFWGHSMGALISFELARELRRAGQRGPQALLVSGHGAPQIPETDPPIFKLPEQEFVAELRRFNGTPKELLENPELTQLFLPTIRADFEVVETYVYEPDEPLACPIHAYGGLEDPSVPAEHLKEWQKLTSGPCKVRMFPGDHFYIHTCAADVINMLRRDFLDRLAQRPTDPPPGQQLSRF